jgi:hypothetical protein
MWPTTECSRASYQGKAERNRRCSFQEGSGRVVRGKLENCAGTFAKIKKYNCVLKLTEKCSYNPEIIRFIRKEIKQ